MRSGNETILGEGGIDTGLMAANHHCWGRWGVILTCNGVKLSLLGEGGELYRHWANGVRGE